MIKNNKTKILSCIVLIVFIITTFSLNVVAKENTIMVSIGDSFSAGEGIEKFYDQDEDITVKVKSQDWLAHRSTESWPGRLILPAVDDKKTMKDFRNDNWYFVASSGATTEHLYKRQPKPYNKEGQRGTGYIDAQLDIFAELRNEGKYADYVTVTIGGNDVEFSEIVNLASIKHSFFSTGELSDKLKQLWADFDKEEEGVPVGIAADIRKAYSDISYAAGPQAKIIVAGYPQLLYGKGGVPFTEASVKMVNENVSKFNNRLKELVNDAKEDGIKICFVSVEDEFKDRGAYADNAYINKVSTKPLAEDLDEDGGASSYSVHPNKDGAAAYAKAVQEKINQLEKEESSEWPELVGSDERDAVLVLDVSGSMNGTPLEETKIAAKRFVNTILYEDVGIGVVTYDDTAVKMSDFTRSENYLNNIINKIRAGGSTNIEAGLMQAEQMIENESVAKKKFVVLMSDGEPNVGKQGDELVAYANELKEKGIRIYTLGFFDSVSNKTAAQSLMEKIASEGCHFEVDDATQLMFFFEDIAEQIKGTKYHYIRIACPVDVTVEYNGEVLASEDAEKTQRTSFGTLTFEENPEENESSSDNRIKVLRLKEGVNYDIHIEGNGKGKMDYTVGYMDENGEYSDMRRFTNVKITKKTEIDTVVTNSDSTTLKVDEDGDGKYDLIYKAGRNSKGKIVDYTWTIVALITPVVILILMIIILIILASVKKKKAAA